MARENEGGLVVKKKSIEVEHEVEALRPAVASIVELALQIGAAIKRGDESLMAARATTSQLDNAIDSVIRRMIEQDK